MSQTGHFRNRQADEVLDEPHRLSEVCTGTHRDLAFDPAASSSLTYVGCDVSECQCGRPACGCSEAKQCTYVRNYGAWTYPFKYVGIEMVKTSDSTRDMMHRLSA